MLNYKNRFFLLSFLFFALSGTTTTAQSNYQAGYAVTNQNDTLYGSISDRKEGPYGGIHEKIRLKGKRFKKRFSPKIIRAYKIGETTFRSLYLDGKMTFLKVVSEGHVNHYVFELQEQGEQLVQEVTYLQKESNGPLVRADQGLFGLKRKRLANFLSDCPELVTKIQNKQFKYVFEVVDFYNVCKANQEIQTTNK